MGGQYNDCEWAKLADSPNWKYSNDSQDAIVSDDFQSVRCSCSTQPFCDPLLNRQSYWCLANCVNLGRVDNGIRLWERSTSVHTRLNIFSAPTNTITIGRTSLLKAAIRACRISLNAITYQGTMVTLNPTSAHTLREVIVLTAISTRAVKVTPKREWTPLIFPTDHTT